MMNGTDLTTETTRITLREVWERSFRTLRVNGVNAGEARTAAEQVRFAEIHHRTGLTELLDDVLAGPWGRAELSVDEKSPGVHTVTLAGGDHIRALRHGTTLLELIAAEPHAALLITSGLAPLSTLLDEPLIRAATTAGRCVSVWEPGSHPSPVRTARPDGSLGFGLGDAQQIIAQAQGGLPNGAVVIDATEHPPTGEITWLSADARQARRTAAAAKGLMVSTRVWDQLGAVAQKFLVSCQ